MEAQFTDGPYRPDAQTDDSASAQTGGRTAPETLKIVPRPEPQDPQDMPWAPAEGASPKRRRIVGMLAGTARKLGAVLAALVAVLVALIAWDHYLSAPWTRDGRVRVQVASVAPEISGRIQELRVADNQFVHKGDVLYVIDPFDFDVNLRASRATLQQRAADQQVKARQSERRLQLSSLATNPEQQQIYAGNAAQAEAAFDAARQQVAQAEVNLKRTEVRSPVNGYVTNLLLRAGDYARQGVANVSIIDADSYWIDGYFEETKMARVCTGARVEAQLMGYAAPIIGHVNTITRGLSVSNAAVGAQGLPNVDPIYTWVRLAQRVPVRIAIDAVPPGVPLVSGLTATVTVRDTGDADRPWIESVRASLSNTFHGFTPRADCISDSAIGNEPLQSVPAWQAREVQTSEQLNPGLATDIQSRPQSR